MNEDEDTCDDAADEDVEVGGEEAKQSEDEQKYDEVVEDGDLEPGQIEGRSNPGRGCTREILKFRHIKNSSIAGDLFSCSDFFEPA